MTRTPTHLSLVFVSLLVTLSACGLGSPGPGSVVKAFFGALQKGNVTEAQGYLELPPGTEAKFAMALASGVHELHDGLDSVEIVKEEVNGETARVDYKLHRKPAAGKSVGEVKEDHFSLRKLDGKWKIEMTLGPS